MRGRLGKIGSRESSSEKEATMGDKGKRDKGNKEEKKKPKLSIKEKRKLKHEKDKKVGSITGSVTGS